MISDKVEAENREDLDPFYLPDRLFKFHKLYIMQNIDCKLQSTG